MNRAAIAALAALLLTGCGGLSTPIPQDSTAPPQGSTAPPPETKVSTCDRVREAFLTGTPAQIKAALQALIKDRGADGTAREYADYYLNRDAKEAQLREMDKSLIVSACTL